MTSFAALDKLLKWYIAVGADEAIGEAPVDRYASRPRSPEVVKGGAPARRPEKPGPAPAGGALPLDNRDPRSLAGAATTLAELRSALEVLEGCALKQTATNLVFGDGDPNARVMFIGEAPGAEEDRQGLPFVGVSGRLLDRMVKWIGLDRTNFYITNIIYWRPPGNRPPTAAEVALCLPFVERHIELVNPQVLILVGGASAKALLGRSEGIMKLRGRWLSYHSPGLAAPIPATAILHTAYLLRSPAQKREAWRDLLMIKAKLDSPL